MGRDMGPELLIGGVGDEVTERLGEELVRDGEVLLAVTEQDKGSVLRYRPRRLTHERRLTQAGLTRDEHDLALSVSGHPLGRGGDRRHLVLPPHHPHRWACGQAAREWDGDPGFASPQRLPKDRDGIDGLGRPFRSSPPTDRHSWRLRRPAMAGTTSAANTCPLSHWAHSRAASTIGSPK